MRTTILLTTSLTLACFAFASGAQAASAKSTYCNNQDFYTNTGADEGKIYPHLHCGKKWVTYSKDSGQKYNFYVGNSIVKAKANNACTQAEAQGAGNLKAKINEMCDDDGVDCDDCN